jgi:hypothetical protein
MVMDGLNSREKAMNDIKGTNNPLRIRAREIITHDRNLPASQVSDQQALVEDQFRIECRRLIDGLQRFANYAAVYGMKGQLKDVLRAVEGLEVALSALALRDRNQEAEDEID